MEVRELLETDAIAYFELRLMAEAEYPEFVGFNAERELAAGRSGIGPLLANYSSEGTVVFGAFDDQKIVGVAALSRRLSPKYRHKALLWGMYVCREWRSRGVARRLMQAVIAWAHGNPEVVAITLQVTVTNERAKSFYEAFGFTIFGTEPRALLAGGEFHAIHCMELCLADA